MTTHWWPIDTKAVSKMGLNARVFGRDVFQRIPVKKGNAS